MLRLRCLRSSRCLKTFEVWVWSWGAGAEDSLSERRWPFGRGPSQLSKEPLGSRVLKTDAGDGAGRGPNAEQGEGSPVEKREKRTCRCGQTGGPEEKRISPSDAARRPSGTQAENHRRT